jgi:hypothetical protein
MKTNPGRGREACEEITRGEAERLRAICYRVERKPSHLNQSIEQEYEEIGHALFQRAKKSGRGPMRVPQRATGRAQANTRTASGPGARVSE